MEYVFSKLDNFRDLGGMAAAGGKVSAPRRLLRSGDLSNVTEADIKRLKEEYSLSKIADLRTKNERLTSPDCEIPDTRYFTMDFFPEEAEDKSTGSREQLKQMQSAEQIHKKMEELYASFITDINVRKQLYQFLQMLLETESGAILFHCYAGKDRTGITAAVILTVLGVTKEDIMKDYLVTNILRKNVNQVIIDSMIEAGQPQAVQEAVRAALSVEQVYLEKSYETAEREYGSFEKYISEGIGLEEEKWERLREMYLISC